MKLLFFIISFSIFVNLTAKAQELDVEQTLAYINKQLNDKNNKYSSYFIGWKNKNYIIDDYKYDVRISHGLLFIVKTFIAHYPDYATTSFGAKYFATIVEELTIPINEINNEYDYSLGKLNECHKIPAVLLFPQKSIEHQLAVLTTKHYNPEGVETEKKTQKSIMYFSINFSNDNLACQKLRNAFTHLIALASKDSRYYTLDAVVDTDPFANTIKKDTVSSAPITTINSNSIPMTKVGGVYEIPVIINGALKLNFIFDAGASDVSISPDVALTLIRTGTLTDKDFLGTETYKFADGSTAKSKVFIIKEIQLGNKKITNVRASISNSVNAPLLLGQSVLNKFGKVTIDYKNSQIIFQN